MSDVVVLGGCGAVGSVAVKALATQEIFDEVVIADANMPKARAFVATLNSPKVKAIPLDAEDPASIKEAIQGADVVLNCVGSFYRTVKTILGAVIESGINYVDALGLERTVDLSGGNSPTFEQVSIQYITPPGGAAYWGSLWTSVVS